MKLEIPPIRTETRDERWQPIHRIGRRPHAAARGIMVICQRSMLAGLTPVGRAWPPLDAGAGKRKHVHRIEMFVFICHAACSGNRGGQEDRSKRRERLRIRKTRL